MPTSPSCRPLRPHRLLAVIVFSSLASPLYGVIDFNTQIRPLLTEHCIRCHGPDESERQADFRIDLPPAAESTAGQAIAPGHPADSDVLRRLVSEDPDERMPPPGEGFPLSAAEVALVRQWIAEGAPFETHWSFRPIRMPAVPAVENLPDAATNIDRFILDRLRRQGLSMSAPADKFALIRRATFDLTGLPPTWQDVQAFLDDDAPDAFARVVDRLLESPRYGERWGRHWLDIARYADTYGGGAIGFERFPFSYTYRDYVIRAFNADLPYNRFVLEQIAADQLGLDENDPALSGLGFLTVGHQFRNIHDLIDDRIDVISRGLLGLTVSCARCHDHKYDPIPTADYYALYATLASSKVPESLPVVGPPPDDERRADYERELEQRRTRYEEMSREHSDVLRHRLRMQVGQYLTAIAKGTPEQDLSTIFLSYRTDDLRPRMIEAWRRYLTRFTVDDPVWGPWHRLTKLAGEDVSPEVFEKSAQALLHALEQENGDLSKLPQQQLASGTPRWNPRVLHALQERTLSSMIEVAQAYGDLFSDVQKEWLVGLLEAASEARPQSAVVPDNDPRHTTINSAINRQLRSHLYGKHSPIVMPDSVAETILNRPIHDHIVGLRNGIHQLDLTAPGAPARAMVLREDPAPAAQYVFRRGNPIDRGAPVAARFLTVLASGENAPFPDGRRRLALAQKIVDPATPVTRRVIVNWVWQHHFGRGLVRTPDDFGSRGDPPTHPELLDYLAEVFLRDGWSIKRLHRRIMLSRVYQQAAVEDLPSRNADPENRLLWRMPRRRLGLEAMRDAMLSVSGRLDESSGGRPFDLFQQPSVPRRTVYGFVNRDVIPGLFSTFDMADPNTCVAKRPHTTVPQQTLFVLNSSFVNEQARELAEHDQVRSAANDEQRVVVLYRRVLSRSPSDQEIRLVLNYVRRLAGASRSNGEQPEQSVGVDAWQDVAQVLLSSNEFVFLD